MANNTPSVHKGIAVKRMHMIAAKQNWTSLNEEIRSVHSGAYGRLDWDLPAVTITTRFDTPSAGRYIHPVFDRTITPREAARIQSFPSHPSVEASAAARAGRSPGAFPASVLMIQAALACHG